MIIAQQVFWFLWEKMHSEVAYIYQPQINKAHHSPLYDITLVTFTLAISEYWPLIYLVSD